MTDRIPLDDLTSDALDALYAERDRLRAELDRTYRRHDSSDALQYALGGLTHHCARAEKAEAERDALAGGVPLACSDERHKTKVGALEAEVERLRAAAQQLLNNGAKAIGEQNWARHHAEERAEKAEAAIERVRAYLEPSLKHVAVDPAEVWNVLVAGAALGEHQEQP